MDGRTDMVKLLLEDGRANPGADYNGSIHSASNRGHIEVVKLLLQDPRVDPSTRDNLAVHVAKQNGHTEIVKLLLQHPRVQTTYSSSWLKSFCDWIWENLM